MTDAPQAAPLKADRVMAEGSGLRALAGSPTPSTSAIGRQPSALDRDAVRDLMWRRAGLFRTREGLAEAVDALERARDARRRAGDGGRSGVTRNLLTVARLIARAALRREESRGGHYQRGFSGTRRSHAGRSMSWIPDT